jgi:hypothetical protein
LLGFSSFFCLCSCCFCSCCCSCSDNLTCYSQMFSQSELSCRTTHLQFVQAIKDSLEIGLQHIVSGLDLVGESCWGEVNGGIKVHAVYTNRSVIISAAA